MLRLTSRATNDGWYALSLDHDFQIYLRHDGDSLVSAAYHRSTNTWTHGPSAPDDLTSNPDAIQEFCKQAVAMARSAGAPSIGFVLLVADEFATAEINPDFDNPGSIPELREAIIADPKSVLHDSTLPFEEHSWRLVPYPASQADSIATAVTLSRRFDPFLSQLRNYGNSNNFPIRTLAASAPLVSLLTLPTLHREPTEKPFIAVFSYSRFTVLACFNHHGDLILIRTLQHRGQRRPSNLRHAATTTAIALEIPTPEVRILPLGGKEVEWIASDLSQAFPDSEVRTIRWEETPFHVAGSAEVFPEMLAALVGAPDEETPLATSHTFSTLRTEGWATQDFSPPAAEEMGIFPDQAEMKLLRAAKFARIGMACFTLAVLAWVGMGIAGTLNKPEWNFRSEEATVVASKLRIYNAKMKEIDHWDNLLSDRSKAWANMELLARFFPEKSGIMLRTFNHSVSIQAQPGAEKAGFVKQWNISGYARDEALEKTLTDFSTSQGISAAFTEVSRVTGVQAFRTDFPTRSIVVNIRTMENSNWKDRPPEEISDSDETTYPYSFDLVITQRFESDDPLALDVTAPPPTPSPKAP
ncbi:hypothetical protein HNR46_002605 [Haloferula luteola]|uniref:Uncharacterized protein n=1 Tax=Haloferula luteola TaxID=595692 RepID=A0A840VET9_9BACT|nr:hypothetical protein [Haloferula luteola]MBB5352360.1 hypothetical protein [Haloferula luteola]